MNSLLVALVLMQAQPTPKVVVLTPGTPASTTLFCTEETQFLEDTNNLEELKQLKREGPNTGTSAIWVVAGVAVGLITGYAVAKAVSK